jgi:hypothetical protein
MKKLLFVVLAASLVACSQKKNEQAEAYTQYVTSVGGASGKSYTCKLAEAVRAATYKDSMEILEHRLGIKDVKTDTLAPHLYKLSDGFKKAAQSYDSLSKVALNKMVSGGMDAIAKSTDYANQSTKNYKEALVWLNTAKLAEHYQKHLNDTIGHIYVCKGSIGTEPEHVDTVLFSPDKKSVVRKLSKN